MQVVNEMIDGTVTFLFTDVVGSTRLWEAHPEAMRNALARHDRLIQAAIEAAEGQVFKTIGDAFCAAFATAGQALDAALAIQLDLAREPEGADADGNPLRLQVRIALHTGVAAPRDGDYFGPPLNRCARLLELAHGQQILLSRLTRDLLPSAPPAGLRLEDLGQHRLRDLGQPEQIFQAGHPDLPADFPPLESVDARPNNLPSLAGRLIGRERELAELSGLLEAGRLVTLTGAGGTGKTRLSIQVAAEQLARHPDGVWRVELAALDEGRLIESAVALAMALQEPATESIEEAIVEKIGEGRVLLLLDNCEHLIDEVARLVERLLVACPGLRCLVTSREGLRIDGELLYPLPPLSLPKSRAAALRDEAWLQAVSDSESVQLFVERAKAVQPTFSLGLENVGAVVEICRRLDGVALAIELAAARVRVLSPEQIAQRLDHHLRLLTGGRRGALPRQQTMRAAVEWSYHLLEAPERLLLSRLAVFAGGWTLDLAERVCASEEIEDWEILDVLGRLIDKSLVVAEIGQGPGRYRMLASIRQLAREKLDASGEEASRVRLAHLDAIVALALAAEPELSGPDQVAQLDRLQREHDNIRAALRFALEAGEAERGLKLASALMRYWQLRGHLGEGLGHLEGLLGAAAGAEIGDRVLAKAHNAAGAMAYFQGNLASAKRAFETSLGMWQELGDRDRVDQLTNNLGVISRSLGEVEAARSYYMRSLANEREKDDVAGIVFVLNNLAMLAHEKGELTEALELIHESLSLQKHLRDPHELAETRCTHAEILWLLGKSDKAIEAAKASLERYRNSGAVFGEAEALEILAKIEADAGQLKIAKERIECCIDIRRELGDAQGVADASIVLGSVLLRGGELAAAEQLIEAGLASAKKLGIKRGIANALQIFVWLELARRDLDGAAGRLREALPIMQELGSRLMTAAGLELTAAVLWARAENRDALNLISLATALRVECAAPRPTWIASAIRELQNPGEAALGVEQLPGGSDIDLSSDSNLVWGELLDEALRQLG